MGVYIGSTPLLWALTVSFILGTAYSMEVWYQLEHHFGMVYLSVHHDLLHTIMELMYCISAAIFALEAISFCGSYLHSFCQGDCGATSLLSPHAGLDWCNVTSIFCV